MSRVLIVGCGAVGVRAGDALHARGHAVIGLRRSDAQRRSPWPMLQGDGASQALHDHIARAWGRIDVVLITATPGLRSGTGGNHLDRVIARCARAWPHARMVYTGSTAVYADTGGAQFAEDAPLGRSPRARALLALEAAVLARGNALVLRAGALAGRRRAMHSPRLASGTMRIRGSMRRSLSWVHEDDLAALAAAACTGLGSGAINVTAPVWPSIASFHRRQAAELGLRISLHDDDSPVPERRIASAALAHRWGGVLQTAWWV
ncbi:MAG: hypothetical protein PF961_02650 [Planctomycetota bacterium]|jgi:nucleoside-diphosphate-sugar epimerase|nr:hypothetical protein [Planctomycetota bacterium]